MGGHRGAWQGSDRKSRLPSNWPKLRKRILRRDGGLCRLGYEGCLRAATEVDHVQRGDNHDPSNLQAVCRACHAKKSTREGVEARLRFSRDREREGHPGLMALGGDPRPEVKETRSA